MYLYFLKTIAVSAIAASGTIGSLEALPSYGGESTINAHISEVHFALSYQAPLDELDKWLEALANLESEHRTDVKILDVNGRHSYGCLQFQRTTFLIFGKKFGFLNEGAEEHFEKFIYDCKLQKRIARSMIEENPEAWKNWYTSVKKKGLGLPPVAQNSREEIAFARIK